jgi:hypothetical protein
MRKFLIFAPPYNEKQGGVICLHKLTDSLNRLGLEAYIFPAYENILINKKNVFLPLLRLGREYLRNFRKFQINSNFMTPIYGGPLDDLQSDEWVVIYYEQVSGNPLKAKNIVRWLLHQPGYHTGMINYGFNEFHIKFNDAVRDFYYPNSKLADFLLPIIDYPLNLYNLDNVSEKRNGTAYCIRKGFGKNVQHDLKNSILIDNLSHDEVSAIFKRVETFISYDSYTAYSRFAALCGCDSIVIPDNNVSQEQWYPNLEDRYGVAYGFENISFARATRTLLLDKILEEIEQSLMVAKKFADSANAYFDEPRYSLFRKKHEK